MKTCFRITCCLILLALLFSLAGCGDSHSTKIDWNVHGVWVNTDGTVQEDRTGVDISVIGSLPTKFENRGQVDLKLDFTWPGCTISPDTGSKSFVGFAQLADKHNNQAFYHVPTWLYYLEENDFTSVSFFLCPEEGFLIAKVRDDYLVASTDESADTEEIFAFYKAYVHVSE